MNLINMTFVLDMQQFPCSLLNQYGFTVPQDDLLFGGCNMFCRNIRHFECAGYYEEDGNCFLVSLQETVLILQEDLDKSDIGTHYCNFYVKRENVQFNRTSMYERLSAKNRATSHYYPEWLERVIQVNATCALRFNIYEYCHT